MTSCGSGLVDQRLDLEHLALAEKRRRSGIGNRHDQRFGNLQVNGAGEADRLFPAIASGRLTTFVPSGPLPGAALRVRSVGTSTTALRDAGLAVRVDEITGAVYSFDFRCPVRRRSPASSFSNICTGWLGMMVEIACL
jgi:hypothetical protein